MNKPTGDWSYSANIERSSDAGDGRWPVLDAVVAALKVRDPVDWVGFRSSGSWRPEFDRTRMWAANCAKAGTHGNASPAIPTISPSFHIIRRVGAIRHRCDILGSCHL